MNSPEKILIIDDEAALRNSFADYLEDRNFEIILYNNLTVGEKGTYETTLSIPEYATLKIVLILSNAINNAPVLLQGIEINNR